jgi:hypothetical protein
MAAWCRDTISHDGTANVILSLYSKNNQSKYSNESKNSIFSFFDDVDLNLDYSFARFVQNCENSVQ